MSEFPGVEACKKEEGRDRTVAWLGVDGSWYRCIAAPRFDATVHEVCMCVSLVPARWHHRPAAVILTVSCLTLTCQGSRTG